jgi:hypothetical protein
MFLMNKRRLSYLTLFLAMLANKETSKKRLSKRRRLRLFASMNIMRSLPSRLDLLAIIPGSKPYWKDYDPFLDKGAPSSSLPKRLSYPWLFK